MIQKGYTSPPTSPIINQVLKGFTDNPFLKKKHLEARAQSSPLRHDFAGGTPNNSDNSGNMETTEEQ